MGCFQTGGIVMKFNKLKEFVNSLLDAPFISSIVFIPVLLLAPLPPLALIFLWAIGFEASVALALFAIAKKHKPAFPGALLFFAIFFLAVNICLARFSLMAIHANESVPFFEFLANLVSQGNFIVAIIISLALTVFQVYYAKNAACKLSEAAARFALDSMAQKNYEVDSMLNDGKISVDQARARRADIRNEANYYSSLDGATKFFAGTAVANALLCALLFAGSIAEELLFQEKTILQAVEASSFIALDNVLLFVFPILVASLSVKVVVNNSSS